MRRVASLSAATLCLICAMTASVFAQIDAENLLSRMIEAIGGANRLGEVKTSVIEGKIILVSQGGVSGDLEITSAYPYKTFIEITIVGSTITQGFDGNVAWIDNPMADGYQELPAEDRENMRRDAIGNDVYLNPEKYGIRYTYKGKEIDAATKHHVFEQVFEDKSKAILYVDLESYLVYKTVVKKGSSQQPIIAETYYSDYRNTDGITQAHQISVYTNDQETMRYLYDQVTYNPEINSEVFQAVEKRFSQEELTADARQLTAIIEDTHPDPYMLIGGKIAYHRHLQHLLHAIPKEGMTKNEFTSLLRPFIAAIRDAHTEVYVHHNVDLDAPGGIPLKFKVAGQSLVVCGISHERYKNLLGAVLLSVEDVSIDELGNRLRILRPIENQYHLLWYFTANYLWYGPYLQELLPEWGNTNQLRASFLTPIGDTVETIFDLPLNVASLIKPPSRIALPRTGESGIATEFIGSDSKIAYLCIDHMKYYRESFEVRNSLGMENRTEEELSNIPSITEQLRTLVKEMKNTEAEALIVDLRKNGGGDALMCDFIMYFLYGKRAVLQTRGNTIMKISDMYLHARENVTLDDINKNRWVHLIEGDCDFSEDYSDEILSTASSLAEGLMHTPTFYEEWESGSYESYHCPPKVIVLTTPETFSAGFYVAMRLHGAGAILVGTPTSQTPNFAASAINWSLNHTGITGRVSKAYALNYPIGSELSRELPVHYPLTLELLRSYDFDPNAEVLYAIDLLPKIAKQKR